MTKETLRSPMVGVSERISELGSVLIPYLKVRMHAEERRGGQKAVLREAYAQALTLTALAQRMRDWVDDKVDADRPFDRHCADIRYQLDAAIHRMEEASIFFAENPIDGH